MEERVSYRSGYYAPRPFKELDPLEKNLLASDSIIHAASRRDVELGVLAAPFRANEAQAYVPVIIEIGGRRYQAIPISQEETAQVARLAYLLAHGTKEGLVGTPQDGGIATVDTRYSRICRLRPWNFPDLYGGIATGGRSGQLPDHRHREPWNFPDLYGGIAT